MDRLPTIGKAALVAAVVTVVACRGEEPTEPLLKRVVSVRATGNEVESPSEFCDVTYEAGKRLRLPELVQQSSYQGSKFRWINVWATWCKPCLAEIPMLLKWQQRLAEDGVVASLEFLSVDEDAQLLAAFQKAHPEFPVSLHLKAPNSMESWLTELGLDQGAGLPINIFADPTGAIRCVRAAALNEAHYATVAKLLK